MSNESNDQKPKKRSITSLTLGWIAEKVRNAERIKEEIQKGTYKVSSEKVAASLLNKENS